MIDVVCGIVVVDGRVLLVQRPPEGRHGGLWEFPGGKVEAGETHAQALARELEEELGIVAEIGASVAQSADDRIRLFAYRIERFRGAIELHIHTALRWVGADDAPGLDLPAADRAIWRDAVNAAPPRQTA